MKVFGSTSLGLLFLLGRGLAAATTVSPVSKVLELLSDLEAKVVSEGEDAKKSFAEFANWCEDQSKQLAYEIKTGESEVATLKATIDEEVATTVALTTKSEELSSSIATAEKELKSATGIRAKEAADFAAEEKELLVTIDTIERAHGLLAKEMQKGAASMLQTQSMNGLMQALSAMVEASVFSSADANRLTKLLQTSTDDEEESLGAPAAAVYESKSGSILETLEDLAGKAEEELSKSRKAETSALHSFEMIKQSLEDQMKFASKDFEEAKKGLGASAQKKAEAEGDLEVTSKDLAEDKVAKEDTAQQCMSKAEDYEAETKSREEEVKAIATAKKVISESTGGAESITYSGAAAAASFIQLAAKSSAGASKQFAAVHFVRDLGRKFQSAALTQLAARMATSMHLAEGGSSDAPFTKVVDLINDMIEKLESDASADATKKAFCDKETSESTAKKEDFTEEFEKLTTKIDQAESKSKQLKEEVAELQKFLAELTASQAEMDKMRVDEKAIYTKNKAEMEAGIEGVKLGLKVLRDYYSKDSEEAGAGTSIIGLLEVVESDFSKGLAEMVATEESSAAAYEKETKENEISKVTKTKDVEYKTKEATELDKSVAELSSDKATVKEELDAVEEYLKKLEEQCVAKPEIYEDRKKAREAEIAGLKEALSILDAEEDEGGASLLQSSAMHHTLLRGVRPHHH